MGVSDILTIILRVLQIIFWIFMIVIAVQSIMIMQTVKTRIDNREFPFTLSSLGINPDKLLGGMNSGSDNQQSGQKLMISDPALAKAWNDLGTAHDANNNSGMVQALQNIENLAQQKGNTAAAQTAKDLVAAINANDNSKADALVSQLEQEIASH